MKKHSISTLSTIFLLLLSSLSLAQTAELKNSTPEERAEFQTDWMKTNLSLDSATAESVESINLKYAKELQTEIDSDGSKIGKLRAFKAISAEKDNELKTVLTPEQYSLYEQKKSELQATLKQELAAKRGSND